VQNGAKVMLMIPNNRVAGEGGFISCNLFIARLGTTEVSELIFEAMLLDLVKQGLCRCLAGQPLASEFLLQVVYVFSLCGLPLDWGPAKGLTSLA
jgi:hypothetical protein